MSSREVRRKVVDIRTPAYSFENIHKTDILKVKTVTDNQGRQFKVGDYPIPGGREELMAADRDGLIPFDENEHRGMGHQVFRSGNTGKWYCMTHNVEFDASALLERRKASSSDIESQDTEQKMIPPNEALEEKGKTQEASWGTAIENEDEVAGEDVKIERQKAQKEKEQKLGVGHLSEDEPTTYKIKKQLENLKNIIKQPASVLKGFDDQFLQGSEEASNAIRDSDQSRKQGIDSGLIPFDEENDHTGSGHQMWGADDGNWFCLAHNVRIPDPRDPGTYGRSDIEQTSLGEALGIERPRIE